MSIHGQFYRSAIWTSKVGQGDLVIDVRSGFASGSVRARLQVSVYSGYDLCHPGCPKMDSYILTPGDPEKSVKPHVTLHPCQIHPRCKFSDCRSTGSRDTADKYFCERLKTDESGSG